MKKAILLLFPVMLSACATVKPEYKLPSQKLSAIAPSGTTKVVLFNTTNPVLFADGSWRIGIKMDGVGVENLHLNKYVQLNLEPGMHKLELSHIDVFTFRNSYQISIPNEAVYIKVYNGITSTKHKIMDSKPNDFNKKYKPASDEYHEVEKPSKL